MTSPAEPIRLHEFDDLMVRVKDLGFDDEWCAWLHAHAQAEGGRRGAAVSELAAIAPTSITPRPPALPTTPAGDLYLSAFR